MQLELSDRSVQIAVSVGVVGLTIVFLKCYFKRRALKKKQNYPKDVVIVHQFPRNPKIPSPSPFCLKLETWLRMADIKYQNDFTMLGRSAKGKVPWITLNEEDVSDSHFCIEFLAKKYNKDLSKDLQPVEKSMARALFKMTEESLFWCMIIHRFKYGKADAMGMPCLIFSVMANKMTKVAVQQGYGRHSKEEVYQIGMADISALENFLGSKTFLFGDKPCNEDAVVFSMISQFICVDNGPFNEFITKQCPNLMRYHDNIRKIYWPDWSQPGDNSK